MTVMNHFSKNELTATERQITDRIAVFIADELIPLMAGYWPKSANQLSSNIRGNAMAYGGMLRGFTAREIIAAVNELAEKEPDRDFAPPAQELKKLCSINRPTEPQKSKFIASMSSIEMKVCAKCISGSIEKSKQAIEREIMAIIDGIKKSGGEVAGERRCQILKQMEL